ncbi:MarR family winged helix-turn-helix transcriptional regulator [Marinibaculum pumilum]|uniref:MarR family winged helix-turn-helix transcriptional regulator n=1 Tax=Marinibaculum pumilum TaxID=1766165 RepID=A0ABV7KV94_9PROT
MTARELRLYHRLQRAAHDLKKAADRRVVEAADLTTAQAAVLAVVMDGEPASQRGVAEALGLNESAVTAMVGRLLTAGYLVRTRSAADQRAWELRLSPAGREVLARIETPFAGVNRRIEEVLSKEEMQSLADCLDRLSDAFRAD